MMKWETIERVLRLLEALYQAQSRDSRPFRLRLTYHEMESIPENVRGYWAEHVIQDGSPDVNDRDFRVIRSKREWRLERVAYRETWQMGFARNEASFVDACRFATGVINAYR